MKFCSSMKDYGLWFTHVNSGDFDILTAGHIENNNVYHVLVQTWQTHDSRIWNKLLLSDRILNEPASSAMSCEWQPLLLPQVLSMFLMHSNRLTVEPLQCTCPLQHRVCSLMSLFLSAQHFTVWKPNCSRVEKHPYGSKLNYCYLPKSIFTVLKKK